MTDDGLAPQWAAPWMNAGGEDHDRQHLCSQAGPLTWHPALGYHYNYRTYRPETNFLPPPTITWKLLMAHFYFLTIKVIFLSKRIFWIPKAVPFWSVRWSMLERWAFSSRRGKKKSGKWTKVMSQRKIPHTRGDQKYWVLWQGRRTRPNGPRCEVY